MCRAYINPFITFTDHKHWRCNFCYRNNIGKRKRETQRQTDRQTDRDTERGGRGESGGRGREGTRLHVNVLLFNSFHSVPDNYDYNPQTGKSGDHSFHQELRHSSVEYIAPSEYMVSGRSP